MARLLLLLLLLQGPHLLITVKLIKVLIELLQVGKRKQQHSRV
jgi:hypothetical protein